MRSILICTLGFFLWPRNYLFPDIWHFASISLLQIFNLNGLWYIVDLYNKFFDKFLSFFLIFQCVISLLEYVSYVSLDIIYILQLIHCYRYTLLNQFFKFVWIKYFVLKIYYLLDLLIIDRSILRIIKIVVVFQTYF